MFLYSKSGKSEHTKNISPFQYGLQTQKKYEIADLI